MAKSTLLTVPEAARELRASPATVYRRLKSGDLVSVKLGGQRFIREVDLERFIAQRVQHGIPA